MQPTARSTSHSSSSHRHGAGRVAQVDQHQGAGVMGDPGQRRHVGQPGRAVGDLADHDERGLRPDHLLQLLGGHTAVGVDVDPAQGQPALASHAVGDVAVGREVVTVDHDLGAARTQRDRGPHQLVEQHGRGVADHGLAGGGAQHERPEVVADPLRQVEPALVPAADQPTAPLGLDELRQPRAGDLQRAAQRVAVEVDERRSRRRRTGRGAAPRTSAASRSAAVTGTVYLTGSR